MGQQTRFDEGDMVEMDADEESVIVGEVAEAYDAIKGSALSGDRREVRTYRVEITSDNVHQDEMVVDEEMDSLRPHN